MSVAALGTSPIAFVDTTGKQFQIPLTLVTFTAPAAQGTPNVDFTKTAITSTGTQQSVNHYVQSLEQQGLLLGASS